jgi:hypothetical protein
VSHNAVDSAIAEPAPRNAIAMSAAVTARPNILMECIVLLLLSAEPTEIELNIEPDHAGRSTQ